MRTMKKQKTIKTITSVIHRYTGGITESSYTWRGGVSVLLKMWLL